MRKLLVTPEETLGRPTSPRASWKRLDRLTFGPSLWPVSTSRRSSPRMDPCLWMRSNRTRPSARPGWKRLSMLSDKGKQPFEKKSVLWSQSFRVESYVLNLREIELLPGPMPPTYLVQSVVCRNYQSILHVWYLKQRR